MSDELRIVRAQRQPLKPGVSNSWSDLLTFSPPGEHWRLLEATSDRGKPFALELQWSAGSHTGVRANVTIAHASRICLYASQVAVKARNLSSEAHSVTVTLADGFAHTANVWEVGEHFELEPLTFIVPPFAQRFQLHLAERAALPGTTVTLLNGVGVRVASFLGSELDQGVLIGGASLIEVLPDRPTDLRGLFQLCL